MKKKLNKKEKQAALLICLQERTQGAINQETIVGRIYPVRWNVLNGRALVQPHMQISKLQAHLTTGRGKRKRTTPQANIDRTNLPPQ